MISFYIKDTFFYILYVLGNKFNPTVCKERFYVIFRLCLKIPCLDPSDIDFCHSYLTIVSDKFASCIVYRQLSIKSLKYIY